LKKKKVEKMSNEEPAISAHPYQPLHSSNLNETLLAQAVDATPPQTPTKTPHTNQTSHFFSPTSTPRALFPQAHTAHHDVSQMHAILQLQSQMLVGLTTARCSLQ
jgi:hypothetical protein